MIPSAYKNKIYLFLKNRGELNNSPLEKQGGIEQFHPVFVKCYKMSIWKFWDQGIDQFPPVKVRGELTNSPLFFKVRELINFHHWYVVGYYCFIFHPITMWLAWGWGGGIGEFPPHPSRFRQYPPCPSASPRDYGRVLPKPLRISEGILQYLLPILMPITL